MKNKCNVILKIKLFLQNIFQDGYKDISCKTAPKTMNNKGFFIRELKLSYGNFIHNKVIYKRDIKKRIANLIKDNEKYFIAEITRTTIDTMLHDDLQHLKMLGYSHYIATEIFEKYSVFLYAIDLYSYIYAPKIVRYELFKLIEEYGLEKVTEEIAIYLTENHSDKFGISLICTT